MIFEHFEEVKVEKGLGDVGVLFNCVGVGLHNDTYIYEYAYLFTYTSKHSRDRMESFGHNSFVSFW